jgi:hypothetical protein
MKMWVIFSILFCFASLYCENKAEDRIYLDGSQIAIKNSQLLVFVENQWAPTNALFSDANGVYILGRKWYEPWECGYCGAVNPPTRLVCWNCNR